MAGKSTVIIGGGVIGLFSAYFLRQLGHEVTIIDRSAIPGMDASSSGNAGLIVPSHFTPLASPGVLKEGLKNLFKPDAPFGIKWSFNPELFSWLWQFYKSSVGKSMDAKTRFLAELHLLSRNLYREIQENQNTNLTLSLSGLLMVSRKSGTFREDAKTAEKSRKLGMPAEIWSADEYRLHNESLDPKVAGAIFYPWDGKVDPLPMLNHLKQWLKENQVVLIENVPAIKWKSNQQRIVGLEIPGRELIADNYLVCAGDQSARVIRELGLTIPLQPAKGYSYLFKNERMSVSHPTLLQDSHVAITPYPTHTRIAGNFLLGNRQAEIPQKRLDTIHFSVNETYPGWNTPKPAPGRSWSGFRPVSPDGLPLIGKSKIYSNLAIATGHAMMGISLAPVTGSLVARLVDGTPMDSRFSPFLDPSRFGNKF